MSVASAVAQSCAQGCATAVNARWGSSYPAALSLLWPVKLTAPGILKSAVGPAPVFTDTPTVDADGVTPGDGPAWEGWSPDTSGGWTRVLRWTPDTASTDITTARELGGGFWATASGLEFRDGTNTASVATSWEASTPEVPVVVTAVVQVTDDGLMRVARGEAM